MYACICLDSSADGTHSHRRSRAIDSERRAKSGSTIQIHDKLMKKYMAWTGGERRSLGATHVRVRLTGSGDYLRAEPSSRA